MSMLKEFRHLWSGAGTAVSVTRALVMNGQHYPVVSNELYATTGDPKNIALRFKWKAGEGVTGTVTLREGDIEAGGFNADTQTFEFFDPAGHLRILQLKLEDRVLVPADTTTRPARKGVAPTILSEFVRLWATASIKSRYVLDVTGERFEILSSELAQPNGAPGHVVLRARWEVGQLRRSTWLTESAILAGRYNEERKGFEFLDQNEQLVGIQLEAGGQILAAEGLPAKAVELGPKVFVVVQEGGSSAELYVHQFDQAEDAQQYRVDSWTDGAYRTSPVVEVPRNLADHPDFNEVVENLLKAALEVDGVE
jgi:hypothetical protein